MALPQHASQSATRFLLHYIGRRIWSHLIVMAAVLSAVGCAIGSQYAVKNLVDMLESHDSRIWIGVGILFGLVAGDNLLWRLAGWVSTNVFVGVGGDVRLDLFHHLSGHGTSYFTDRFPGALAGRIVSRCPDNDVRITIAVEVARRRHMLAEPIALGLAAPGQ